ncbi:TPA: hypothetical protein ENS27_15865 [bacterium]|nr:hypothetical protein [bacterium]
MRKKIISKIYLLWAIFIIISVIGCVKQNIDENQILAKSSSGDETDEFINLIKFHEKDISGWKLASKIRMYDKNNIFDYIDGAAELYFAYDFFKVVTAEYQNGQTSILVDVYDMTNSENAFGIYSLNRYKGANYVRIGNEGILEDATLEFWKGQYYCKVYSFNQSEEYQKIVADIGSKIASRIHDFGKEPNIIKRLPQDGLIHKTEQFFTRKLGLDNVYFISDENVLELDGQTKGIIAEYQLNDKTFHIFMVEYPSPEKAISAFDTYSEYLTKKGEINEKKVYKVENRFTYIKLGGNIISGFWDVESEELMKIALDYIR